MPHDYSIWTFKEEEQFALRSFKWKGPSKLPLFSHQTVDLNLPLAGSTLETTPMGKMIFFSIHICKNVKKIHFNMIQAHIYLYTKKLKKKIHIIMLLLFIVFHKCPVCNKVYLETKSSTRSPCNTFIARQWMLPQFSGLPWGWLSSSLI